MTNEQTEQSIFKYVKFLVWLISIFIGVGFWIGVNITGMGKDVQNNTRSLNRIEVELKKQNSDLRSEVADLRDKFNDHIFRYHGSSR